MRKDCKREGRPNEAGKIQKTKKYDLLM